MKYKNLTSSVRDMTVGVRGGSLIGYRRTKTTGKPISSNYIQLALQSAAQKPPNSSSLEYLDKMFKLYADYGDDKSNLVELRALLKAIQQGTPVGAPPPPLGNLTQRMIDTRRHKEIIAAIKSNPTQPQPQPPLITFDAATPRKPRGPRAPRRQIFDPPPSPPRFTTKSEACSSFVFDPPPSPSPPRYTTKSEAGSSFATPEPEGPPIFTTDSATYPSPNEGLFKWLPKLWASPKETRSGKVFGEGLTKQTIIYPVGFSFS